VSSWFPAALVAELEQLLGRRVGAVTEEGVLVASPGHSAGGNAALTKALRVDFAHSLERARLSGFLRLRFRQKLAARVDKRVDVCSDSLHFLGADLHEVRVV
jgi:hypothetical protein